MNGTFTLASTAFIDRGLMPSQYTCDGTETPPPLSITGVPSDTRSLALIMDDPDVPTQLKADGVFDHWILFNIPPSTVEITPEITVGTPGLNSANKTGYVGPCPPPQFEPQEHRYVFTLYALSVPMLSFDIAPTKQELLQTMEGHIIAQAQLTGRYQRH